jgi:predicted ATP-grasp superfamily ATP-dependent carboligase
MDACSARLVVIGASCRAFAASATAAGWRVHAADLFGDLDLDAVAAASVCVRDISGGYPAALVDAVRGFPPAAFCYVGAIENHPDVLRAVAADRRLLGSPPEALAAVRDPWSLRELVRTTGLDCPDSRRSPDGLPTDGSYLRKPLAGAGRGLPLAAADRR